MYKDLPLEKVKRYLGLWGHDPLLSKDDVLLEENIDRAIRIIEKGTHRTFQGIKQTRRYDYPEYPAGTDTLLLDYDLRKIIKLGNGDGTLIPAADRVLLPYNETPHYGIRLINDACWTYDTTPTACIAVRAWWGSSMVPDFDCQQAIIRLTAYLYKQKDAQTFESTAFLDGGVMVIPQGMPKSVANFILDNARTL